MYQQYSNEVSDGSLYLAGECVPPGIYRDIESRREVCLSENEVLPASLDGRVACYMRVDHTWEQVQHTVRANKQDRFAERHPSAEREHHPRGA